MKQPKPTEILPANVAQGQQSPKTPKVSITADLYEQIEQTLEAFCELEHIIDGLDDSPSRTYKLICAEASRILEELPPLERG